MAVTMNRRASKAVILDVAVHKLHMKIITNPLLNWYINLFCNRLQKLPDDTYCDMCWAYAMIITHFLLGWKWELGAFALFVFVVLKQIYPTEHDQGEDESGQSTD